MTGFFQPSDPHPDSGPSPSWMDDRFLTVEADAARHRQYPEVTAAEYAKAMRLSIYRQIAAKTKVYLDQRFWIFCRDARAGHPSQSSHSRIWRDLLDLVRAGKVICPATYPVLTETLKQGDMTRRMQTAETIDELSTGVAIQNPQAVAHEEMMFLLSKVLPVGVRRDEPDMTVWTSAAFALGELHRDDRQDNDHEALAIHKAMMDAWGRLRLPDLIQSVPDITSTVKLDDSDTQGRHNALAVRTRHLRRSYKAQLLAEVEWAVGHYLKKGFPDREVDALCRLICSRFRRNPDAVAPLWPSVHIPSAIYAGVNHKSRRFERGDSYDHMHATAALAYCDCFFTERKLGTLLTEGPLRLDKPYRCRVAWEADDVLKVLQLVAAQDGTRTEA